MKNTIETAAGKNYSMDLVRNYMDDEICESIHGTTETDQEFYEKYCKIHAEKYGEDFIFESENPQI